MSQLRLRKSLNNEAYFLNFVKKWSRSILRSRARMKVQPTQDVLHSDCRTSGEPIVFFPFGIWLVFMGYPHVQSERCES